MLHGGCYCGQVRYEAGGTPFHSTLCHCSDCRRINGAPVVAWFSVACADFRFVAGQPTRFASSPGVTRSFCPACGTSLTYQSSKSLDELDVTTASLDHPDQLPPDDHTQTAGRLPWIRLSDGLPRYPGTRDEEPDAPTQPQLD